MVGLSPDGAKLQAGTGDTARTCSTQLSYWSMEDQEGLEPPTTRLTIEVTDIYATPAVLYHSGTSNVGLWFVSSEGTGVFTTIGRCLI